MKRFRADSRGFIPLIIMLFLTIIVVIVFVFLRVQSASGSEHLQQDTKTYLDPAG